MNLIISGKVITISLSSAKDCPYCHNLSKRNMAPYYKKYKIVWKGGRKFRKRFTDNTTYIMRYNGRRIGFLSFMIEKNICHFVDLQITTYFRNQRLGTKALEIVEKEAKKSKISRIQLRVFHNNKAVELYERKGFSTIRKTNSVFIMEKIIPITQ